MKITGIDYERLFSLGQYENERIGIKVSVDVTENPIDVFKDTKALVLSLHEEGKLLEESQRVAEAEKPVTVVTEDKKPTEAQFNAPNWVTKDGSKGNYQQAENDKTETFRIIQQYVKSKGGFCNIHGFKTWFHNNNENIIDRKR
jgi:hypothetical protein